MNDRAKRRYQMGARAKAAAKTKEAIIEAANTLFGSHDYDSVTLAAVAREAGVSVPTVVRVVESKSHLIELAAESMMSQLLSAMKEIPKEDGEAALKFLIGYYEEWGDRAIRLAAQERRVPLIRTFLDQNRYIQQLWIDRLFDAELDPLTTRERKRAVITLMTMTGVYSWHVLRRIHGSSPKEVHTSMREMTLAYGALLSSRK